MFAQITEIKYKNNLSIKKSIPLGDAVNLNTDANFTEWHHTSNIAKQLYCNILGLINLLNYQYHQALLVSL